VLLESHVAFHTWPASGVISLDLFTCGSAPLLPVLPTIEGLFGVPIAGAGEGALAPAMVWAHKLRGFRQGFSRDYKKHENPLEQDLGADVLATLGYDRKVRLASEETDFQQVDVWEVAGPRASAALARSLADDGSYEALHPELFQLEKMLFLDGTQQSTLYGDAAYHEALVHPALVAHVEPKRVAIIGGGEGATLREVLKHASVEEVVMVEIDEELVELCREHLPEWSDCSDSAGSDADSCFDDSRTTMMYMDAFAWFLESFGDASYGDDSSSEDGESGDSSSEDAESEEQRFDVIVMDALDPDQFVEIVGDLYKDNNFVSSLFNGLTEEGIFVIQMGQSDTYQDPAMDSGPSQDARNMMSALQSVGFESIHMYDEAHSQFGAPWSYFICFKDYESRADWHRSPAETEVELHRRLHRTNSGAPVLRFFDGSTMEGYQIPPRVAEAAYCRMEDRPEECDMWGGITPQTVNVPVAHLEARKSAVGGQSGRGLFAVQDIPAGAVLDLDGVAKSFHLPPSTWSVIEDLGDVTDTINSVNTFVEGYGVAATVLGDRHYTVDSGISNFCNHGCDGAYNYGYLDADGRGLTEANVDLDQVPEDILNAADAVYSPLYERHLRQKLTVGDSVLRGIRRGEEILCNYLYFVGDSEDWAEDVTSLRRQCSGEEVGSIQEYELYSSECENSTDACV